MYKYLIKWLSVADRHTKMYLDQQFAPLGINSSQHMYILAVCEDPGISQEQLMDLFYIHPSNITRALNFLINTGFITRQTNENDKRTRCLYPTEKAQTAAVKIREILGSTKEKLMESIPPEEAEKMADLLEKMALNAANMIKNKERSD